MGNDACWVEKHESYMAMDIFHDLIGKTLEVYINDVVIKSNECREYMHDLPEIFYRMKKSNLKINPLKYTFGVSIWNFF